MLTALAGLALLLLGPPAQAAPAGAPGSVLAWGANYQGQLGRGFIGPDDADHAVVPGLSGVVAVSAGGAHSLALKADGTVWGWGAGDAGSLGTAAGGRFQTSPIRVLGLSRITQIAAGGPNLAVDRDGAVWMWGITVNRRDGATPVPQRMWGLPPTVAVVPSLGARGGMVLLRDGRVMTWGENEWGELGDGTSTEHWMPTAVPGLPPVRAIASGGFSRFAVTRGGQVYSWGENPDGQLGDGTTQDRASPVRVAGLSSVRQISASNRHVLALTADGQVFGWGWNIFGQAGDGTAVNRSRPSRTRIGGVVAVSAGWGDFSVALRGDGSVWTWGSNMYAELGHAGGTSNGDADNHPVPARVPGITDARAVSAGGFHTLILA